MDFLDIHTHQARQKSGVTAIQSLSVTENIFLAMPKTKPIAVGIHPWYARLDQLELQMSYLTVLAQQTNVKLIGECGLDQLRGEKMENQTLILEQQVQLAEKLQKPLIMHCVKAFSELIDLKRRLNIQVPVIIHGFNKKPALGKSLLAHGFLLSFGSAIMKDSGAAQLLAGLDQFYLETDDSDVGISEIYQRAADLKKCSVDELKALIFTNWKKLNLIERPN